MEEDTVLLGVGLELFLQELNVSAIAANAIHAYDKVFIKQVYGILSSSSSHLILKKLLLLLKAATLLLHPAILQSHRAVEHQLI